MLQESCRVFQSTPRFAYRKRRHYDDFRRGTDGYHSFLSRGSDNSNECCEEFFFHIQCLEPLAFIGRDGKEIRSFDSSATLKDRPANLSYVRFQGTLCGQDLDPKLSTAGVLTVQFCLKLPRHVYTKSTNTVELEQVCLKHDWRFL
mmetsp:Transcript_5114/g.5638  ORF Transcript_5114/g.5638 Transcript_5114/m.5638 type:complete len:146 (-) Transcript_5114:80-517(-)